MSRHQEFICGLSHEVTIAVLPRLNMEELMFELNRRIQNLDKDNSIKDRLVSILRDVMLEEYCQWESSPDETTIPVQDQETGAMQENVLTVYAETILSETSSPDTSQQRSGLDNVIKKERDASSDLLVPQFDTEQVQLTAPQQDHPCNVPGPLTGLPKIPSCEAPLTQMNTITNSCIKEEDVAMPTEDEAVIACHDELNIHTPISSTQEPDTLNLMKTSTCSRTNNHMESDTPRASCQLPPDHGGTHIKMNCQVSQDDQNSSMVTPLALCQPTPDQDCANKASLRPDGSNRYVCKLKSSSVNSSSKHRKCQKGERPFICGECGYRARLKYRLVEHMRTHTGEKPFKCNHCNYKTSLKRTLDEHMKRHTDTEPYSCEICGYQTYRKPVIETHLKCHSGVKPYKCEECDFRTAHSTALTRHRRCHTGERPYSCQECDYKARVKCNLLKHMKRKHL
ncbi:gastrula zinc finger protein XlCGF48.2-like isoform X1 [Branchiostoma floridae]|uniref:Gastrula zinc finger protein XlCGF48.2-like isoform X1 n=1 Tax=Branchiostoma floridae TaxID=7739 RepID=A0A9J7KJU3_BRAFL|nr:gastrula zinc finger protein XlCGF48.2-like isoform X1 [Branchiostoma floridae]XP_035662242.1 gastrula zinc finger protein XlCGF48.2-like isoform X1 [Branchiostoma floridae]